MHFNDAMQFEKSSLMALVIGTLARISCEVFAKISDNALSAISKLMKADSHPVARTFFFATRILQKSWIRTSLMNKRVYFSTIEIYEKTQKEK